MYDNYKFRQRSLYKHSNYIMKQLPLKQNYILMTSHLFLIQKAQIKERTRWVVVSSSTQDRVRMNI